MILPPVTDRAVSPMMIEGGLTAIAVAVAFAFPRLGSSFFPRVERAFARLARRKTLCVGSVGCAALLLRLAILPLSPIPHPFFPDDFSFLLAANTFAAGRLTNPTPALWTHFESLHITMTPTYMSMYFPGQGLVLAAGKVLLGNPWFGTLLSSALMCAAIVWMLQAWLPPGWALLGGVIAILRLGLFSYWIDTYSGSGSIGALGGALLLGGLPRFMKTVRPRDSLWMGIGIALLALSRPYEGILLCIPVLAVLARWMLFAENRPAPAVLVRRVALPAALIVAAVAWIGYYNHRAFGSPLTPPYAVNRATYAMAPYFVWQSARPEPVYRHAAMREFYYHNELDDYQKIHRPAGFVPYTLLKVAKCVVFFAGIALLPPLIMVRRVFLDRRLRFLILCVLVLMAGMSVEIFIIPHYVSPFTAAFYAIGLQAMRHLRVWRPAATPVGMTLARFIVLLCVVMTGVRLFAAPLRLQVSTWPQKGWVAQWYGLGPLGTERANIETTLQRMPGKQLAIVRYSPSHLPANEWIYNGPDIGSSKVIWAWDMGPAKNRELLQFYKGRKVWLVQPDLHPAALSPYVLPAQPTSASAVNQAMPAGIQDKSSKEPHL